MTRRFQNFSVCFGNPLAKKKAEDSIDTFVIASPMASACLGILRRAMIWFLNSWDYFFYLIILVTYETLEWVKRKTLFLSLITSFWFWFWFWFWLTSEAVARRCSIQQEIRNFLSSYKFRKTHRKTPVLASLF